MLKSRNIYLPLHALTFEKLLSGYVLLDLRYVDLVYMHSVLYGEKTHIELHLA